MKPTCLLLLAALLAVAAATSLAADLPPDKTTEIPASAKREVVVTLDKSAVKKMGGSLPKHDLPAGFTLSLAAAPPLVTHPIMGCLDDRGRLFIGDGVGVNWNKAQLEANPPNRVLMLEDTDKDGAFDKSTIFADKMTFPQGACWLDGSLYVCSPPGLWKLTDTNGDGVADQREMIVGGFEYTGNAADVHGPFLHPNGRLYWCHGRKGHKITQKDGALVDESLACGIWSCKPDGSDVAWHSLGCGDNPVEVDFTPKGDVIGVQNLYYSQPRGDTIVHWLQGGVYERSDQLKAIAHLPRTLETMPVMYNFGHVAVSGCCFWKSYPGTAGDQPPYHFLVTHFNTQRLVRVELTPDGATYKAVENEFLKLYNPDIHPTDVMEDPRDGSLLLLDTGGWFRIGCPSSLMAKSDILGAVYRISPARPLSAPVARSANARASGLDSQIANLKSKDAMVQRRACESIASIAARQGLDAKSRDKVAAALEDVLKAELDPALEHAAIASYARAAHSAKHPADAANPDLARRMLMIGSQCRQCEACRITAVNLAFNYLDAADSKLASTAMFVAANSGVDAANVGKLAAKEFEKWISSAPVSKSRLAAVESLAGRFLDQYPMQQLLRALLEHHSPELRGTALKILASQTAGAADDSWFPALEKLLANAPSPLLLDAIKRLKTSHFDAALQAIAADAKRPLAIRLKALDSAKSVKLTGETFDMVKKVVGDAASSSAAKIQAASMIAAAPLQKPQVLDLAPLFANIGPVELKTLLPLVKRHKDADTARAICSQIAKNPAIASQQESLYRTALADLPVDIFETIILPAYNAAIAASEAKKRQLGPLSDKVIASGSPASGKKHFEAGKGTCIACHKIGDVGRPIGPDLSKIGAIRTERDLLESILFPSNTLARDYEAHVIETSDGQQITGVIKSHTAEGLQVIDIAGQEKTIAHQAITGDTTLPASLMPQGLDQTMPEGELLDLVAFLRSLK